MPRAKVVSRVLSPRQIAWLLDAEVLSDDEAARLLERVELARQSDAVVAWNRSLREKR